MPGRLAPEYALVWQWLRLPGDVVFAVAALFMAWDFPIKLGPVYPQFVARVTRRPSPQPGE